MSSSLLPEIIVAALPKVQQAASAGNTDAFEQWKQWGYDQIDVAYKPHPIKRPHYAILKVKARLEWERQVQELSKLLQQAMTNAAVAAFDDAINAPLRERQWLENEGRRRDSLHHDTWLGVDAQKTVRTHETDEQIRLLEAQARLAPPPPQTTSAADTFRMAQEEITRIEQNSWLSDEERHRRTEAVYQSLPHAMQEVLREQQRGHR